MRSSTSRLEAEWTEASRKTAALFTHPESAPASSARLAALSATASSETSPITEIARGLAGWSSVQASVSGSSSMETTAFSSASSRSRSTIAPIIELVCNQDLAEEPATKIFTLRIYLSVDISHPASQYHLMHFSKTRIGECCWSTSTQSSTEPVD